MCHFLFQQLGIVMNAELYLPVSSIFKVYYLAIFMNSGILHICPVLLFPTYKMGIKRELATQVFFPDSSVGKESACNAGDPCLIPGSGIFAGERIGYPLQYSWAFLMAQLVKNLPAMQETWVRSLSWEDPMEKGKATHSSILPWRIPWTVQFCCCCCCC